MSPRETSYSHWSVARLGDDPDESDDDIEEDDEKDDFDDEYDEYEEEWDDDGEPRRGRRGDWE